MTPRPIEMGRAGKALRKTLRRTSVAPRPCFGWLVLVGGGEVWFVSLRARSWAPTRVVGVGWCWWGWRGLVSFLACLLLGPHARGMRRTGSGRTLRQTKHTGHGRTHRDDDEEAGGAGGKAVHGRLGDEHGIEDKVPQAQLDGPLRVRLLVLLLLPSSCMLPRATTTTGMRVSSCGGGIVAQCRVVAPRPFLQQPRVQRRRRPRLRLLLPRRRLW